MIVDHPTFLILGAQKAGTTALYHYLRQHPQVHMSPIKEPGHFAHRPGGPGYRWADGNVATSPFADPREYARLFSGAGGARAAGEASTLYLYVEDAARRIREQLPSARLVAVLRNPIDRAYSAFTYLRRDGREPIAEFEAALAAEPARREHGWEPAYHYFARGLYAGQVQRFRALFDREQFAIYLYDDLVADPQRLMCAVFQHVGVDPGFVPDTSSSHNVSGIPRAGWQRRVRRFLAGSSRWKRAMAALPPPVVRRRLSAWLVERLDSRGLEPPPRLPPEARQRLAARYREDIERLGRLIDRDLSRWLAVP